MIAVVYENPLLPHQVRIKGDLETNMLTVTCSCLVEPGGAYTPLLDPCRHLGPRELLAAFAKHEKEVSGHARP